MSNYQKPVSKEYKRELVAEVGGKSIHLNIHIYKDHIHY